MHAQLFVDCEYALLSFQVSNLHKIEPHILHNDRSSEPDMAMNVLEIDARCW